MLEEVVVVKLAGWHKRKDKQRQMDFEDMPYVVVMIYCETQADYGVPQKLQA